MTNDCRLQIADCGLHAPSITHYALRITQHATRTTHIFLYLSFLFTAIFLTGFGSPRLVDRFQAPTQRLTLSQLREWQAAQTMPTLSAQAFLVYDVTADEVLFTNNSEVAVPVASLTKLMTALLVLEQNVLTATVIIEGADLIGDASMGLVAGERLTVEQLLWGMLIPSGNDAAMALARHSAGSVDAFVERMNQRSQALGLHQTHFANPHGLDAPGHVSSAADLLSLTRQLWGYPLFREIVQTAEITIAGHRLRSTNELLATFPGANGVKTGTSDAAGQCLIASIERDRHLLWIIVLGSQDRYANTRALVAHAEANYRWATGNPNELPVLNRVYGENGTVWYLRAVGAPPTLLLRPWETNRLRAYRRLQLPPSELPWQPGMEVGMLEWLLDDKIVGRQSLVLW